MKIDRFWRVMIGLGLIALAIGLFYYVYTKPLGVSLPAFRAWTPPAINTPGATAAPGAAVTGTPVLDDPMLAGEDTSALPTIQPVGQAFTRPQADPNATTSCGLPPLLFVLVTGHDENNLADAIRIVRIDAVKSQVSVLAIQRATWVNLQGLEEKDIYASLINTAHSRGDYFWGPGGGVTMLAYTLYTNFGIGVDRYIDVSFDAFTRAVDTIGGVDVFLPESLDGTLQGLDISFKAGWNHLDGKTALKYVRIRFPDSDWQRINRQTGFVQMIMDKMRQPHMLPRLPGLVGDLSQEVSTDLSPAEIASLTCLAGEIPKENIRFYEIGPDMVTPTTLPKGGQIMLPKMELVGPFIQAFIAGTLP